MLFKRNFIFSLMKMRSSYIPLIAAVVFVTAATIIMLILGKTGWPGAYQNCAAYGACHCEAFRTDRYVLQPTNTWSNYGFVLAGLIMFYILAKDPRYERPINTGQTENPFCKFNFMKGNNLFSITYASVVILCGLTSAYFHASMRAWANILDVVAMYMFITFLPIYTACKMTRKPEKWFLIVYFPLNILFTLARIFVFQLYLRLLIFYIFLGFATILELFIYVVRKYNWRKPKWFPVIYRKSTYLFLAMGSFVLGYIIWNLWQDGGVFCDPESWFQGHAVWHLLCAVSTWFIFLYLRSEMPISCLDTDKPNAVSQ